MSAHLCGWLEAAGWLGLQLRLGIGGDRERERIEVIIGNLLMMCRTEFAAGLAHERLSKLAPSSSITDSLTRCADAHALLVSAHQAWATLEELGRLLRAGSFAQKAVLKALRTHRPVMRRCETARDHIEHVTERLGRGRSIHFGRGKTMTAKVFRQSIGAVTQRTITFGNESFDLAEQIAALTSTRKMVAPAITAAATPQMRGT